MSVLVPRRRVLRGVSALPLVAAAPSVFSQEPPLRVALPMGVGAGHDLRGPRVQAGVATCFKRFNAAGAIHGRSIELLLVDDDGTPGRLAERLKEAARQRGVLATLATLGERASEAGAAVADELGLPLVAPLSGAEALDRTRHPSVFRLRPGQAGEARALAQQLRGMGCSHAALLHDAGPPDSSSRAIGTALEQQGLRVSPLPWDAAGAPVLEALSQGSFQVAVLNLGMVALSRLFDSRLGERAEWPGIIAAISSGDPGSVLGCFTRRNVVFTSVVPHPEVLTRKLTREFNADVDQYGSASALTFEGLEAYLGARLVVEALRRLGGNRRPGPQDLQSALESTSVWDIADFRLDFSKGHATGSDRVHVVMRSRSGVLMAAGPGPGQLVPRAADSNLSVPSGAVCSDKEISCLSS